MSRTTRLTGDDARLVSTSIRLPVNEHLAIKRAARREHLTVSDYIRRRLGASVSGGYRQQEQE